MTADRIVTASELPLLFEMTAARMGQFSIGFVKILGNEDDAVIAGAGTLVTAGRRFGILTADHVLAGLPKQGSVRQTRQDVIRSQYPETSAGGHQRASPGDNRVILI